MNNDPKSSTLPYRTTGDELTRLVEARARGRELSQIQALNFASKQFDGTLVAAYELGFLDPDTKDLTPQGREYALVPPEEKPALLRDRMKRFEPYALLLEAIFDRGAAKETPLEWVEKWWSTHGYGNSQTNRAEGSVAFGKLSEYAQIGRFVLGRRGLASRIEWDVNAGRQVRGALAVAGFPNVKGEDSPELSTYPSAPSSPPPAEAVTRPSAGSGNSCLSLPLSTGRSVELSIPPKVTAAEKKRLLSLIDLMIEVEEVPSET